MAIRLVISLGLLLFVAWRFGTGDVLSRLGRLRVVWVVAGLAVSVVQVAASAWRWRFTAAQLGIELRFADALQEYYLATFLNQVLPGGVAGDLARAWRHASLQTRLRAPAGPAVRAVILERASGQMAMLLVALLSFASLPIAMDPAPVVALIGIGAAFLAIGTAVVVWIRRLATTRALAGRIWRDTRAALLSRGSLPVQLAASSFIVGTYVAKYVIAARALGIETPLPVLVPLVAPVLMTMLLPVTIAGWGLREGTAGALWTLAGLTAVDGVAISVAYGLLVLVSSVPGALVLFRTPDPDPELGAPHVGAVRVHPDPLD